MQLITLLSDLGDYSAGVAKTKSILMQQLPGSVILDVTHNIYPFYLQEAAYLLASSMNDFPQGSFHVVLFDLHYDTTPKLILAEVNGRYILAPDNGVVPLAAPHAAQAWLCCEMTDKTGLSAWTNAIADTIRMITDSSPSSAGLPLYELQNAPLHCRPVIYQNYVECYVIHIDRFENIVLNITKGEFEAAARGRSFSIDVIRNDTITVVSNHYNSVKPGEKLARFNSAGYLEIAINKGNAAGLFGLRMAREKNKAHSTIKINFE